MKCAGNGLQSGPEQSVMHEQKIDILLRSCRQYARRNIHRRADFRDAAGVFDLQTVSAFSQSPISRMRRYRSVYSTISTSEGICDILRARLAICTIDCRSLAASFLDESCAPCE